MGIVVGFATSASVGSACAVNASWGVSPNSQHLFCLNGSFSPFKTINKATENANLTVYSPGPSADVSPSSSCDKTTNVTISISPAGCGGGAGSGMSGGFFVQSYGYSKDDAQMPGQETWGVVRFIAMGDTPEPNYVLKGIAEGQWTDNAGVEGTALASSSAGQVSAGGIGRSDDMSIGTVSSVGGGSSASGDTGNASVSCPLTPLWTD